MTVAPVGLGPKAALGWFVPSLRNDGIIPLRAREGEKVRLTRRRGDAEREESVVMPRASISIRFTAGGR